MHVTDYGRWLAEINRQSINECRIKNMHKHYYSMQEILYSISSAPTNNMVWHDVKTITISYSFDYKYSHKPDFIGNVCNSTS